MIRELTDLLPTLVAHSGVEGAAQESDATKLLVQKAEANGAETTKVINNLLDQLKTAPANVKPQLVDELPAFLRPLAKKVIAAHQTKANYGAK